MSFDLLVGLTVEAVRTPVGWEVRVSDGAGVFGSVRADDLSQALMDVVPTLEAAFTVEVDRHDSGGAFVCGDPIGCRCSTDCEFPCFQRVGLTSEPCCSGCRPLPSMSEEGTD